MPTQHARLCPTARATLGVLAASTLAGCADGAEPLGPPLVHTPRYAAATGPLAVTSITGLEPVLDATLPWSEGHDINDLGFIVGWSGTANQSFRGAVWEPGSLFPIQLGELPGGGENVAYAINSAGTVIVGAGEIPGGDRHAVRWLKVNGTWTVQDLGTLDQGGMLTSAYDIADDGTVVGVDYADPAFDHPRGFIWRNGVMMNLGPFGIRVAYAVNNSGQVAGVNADLHAVLWTQAGGAIDLGTLGGAVSVAYDINTNGEVVGQSETSSGKRHAFLWTPRKGMIDLGPLDAETSSALSINDEAQVIGTVQAAPLGPTHAFVWSKGKILDLGLLPGYEGGSSFANAINNKGHVVGRSDVPLRERGTLWMLK
jgi:probable HAF family extracellular repeat protein